MTDCERLRADAPGLAALPPEDPERAAAEAHAAGCPGCARALREAEKLEAILGEAGPADAGPGASPAGALDVVAAGIEHELVRERRRRSGWAAIAAAAAAAVLVALAHHRGGTGLDWALAAALCAGSVALAALAARAPALALGGAGVAGAAVLLAGRAGPAQPGTGVHCLATELACAAVVVGAAWLALRGGTTRPARASMAAAAAAGAVAGAGALQVSCPAQGVGLHLLAFHAGGVLVAALVAALWRPRRATPA